jgi:acetyl esterase/lipase
MLATQRLVQPQKGHLQRRVSLQSIRGMADTAIELYDAGRVPHALGNAPHDAPRIDCWPVPPATPRLPIALLIFPGGGYHLLADHEGAGYADWFRARGVTCFVLKYRLASNGYRFPAILGDACRAIQHLRSMAASLGIEGFQIGVMGSSAGGHLAASLSTLHGQLATAYVDGALPGVSARPDFSVLCYPVISFLPDVGHQGSRRGFLGDDQAADEAAAVRYSCHLNVAADTPPAFLWHTAEDAGVPAANSLLYARALLDHQVPVELHVYPDGRHGLGLNTAHPWAEAALRWMTQLSTPPAHES